MSELSPALAAALRGDRPLLFGAVSIALPGYDLLLLDGSGELMIGGRRFVSRDPVYGVIDSVKGIVDSMGDQAPAVTLGLIPGTTAGLAQLLDPAVQGSRTTFMVGCIDIATGLVVPDPYVLFAGELDVPTVKWGQNDRRLEYRVTSIAERLFATEEAARLTDSWHQSIWPGELGLSLVTDVEGYIPWGQKIDLTAVETRTNLPALGQSTTKRT